jgi:DNA primase
LREGHSFRFAFLPEGSDPDDLVRSKGAKAFAECLAAARPLIDVLWQRERKAQAIDTPERRAAFEARLDTLLGQIGNTRVRDHYRREAKNRLFALWREQGTRRGKQAADNASRPSAGGPTPLPSAHGFATVIVLALVNHPVLLDRFGEEVAHLDIKDKALAGLLQTVTRTIFADAGLTREQLVERLGASSFGKLFARLLRDSAFKRVAFLNPDFPAAEVEEQFADLIYRFRALPNLNRELHESADRLAEASEAEFERFAQLQQQVASVGSQHAADDAGDRDAAQRFHDTVARLKGERLERGRRQEKRD